MTTRGICLIFETSIDFLQPFAARANQQLLVEFCRFCVHRITGEEAKYKLCRVLKVSVGPNNVPMLSTNDGRTIRYPDPLIKANNF